MKVFNRWGEALSYLLANTDAQIECRGKVWEYKDALLSCGYEGAKKRNLLDDYKRLVLGE